MLALQGQLRPGNIIFEKQHLRMRDHCSRTKCCELFLNMTKNSDVFSRVIGLRVSHLS